MVLKDKANLSAAENGQRFIGKKSYLFAIHSTCRRSVCLIHPAYAAKIGCRT